MQSIFEKNANRTPQRNQKKRLPPHISKKNTEPPKVAERRQTLSRGEVRKDGNPCTPDTQNEAAAVRQPYNHTKTTEGDPKAAFLSNCRLYGKSRLLANRLVGIPHQTDTHATITGVGERICNCSFIKLQSVRIWC